MLRRRRGNTEAQPFGESDRSSNAQTCWDLCKDLVTDLRKMKEVLVLNGGDLGTVEVSEDVQELLRYRNDGTVEGYTSGSVAME